MALIHFLDRSSTKIIKKKGNTKYKTVRRKAPTEPDAMEKTSAKASRPKEHLNQGGKILCHGNGEIKAQKSLQEHEIRYQSCFEQAAVGIAYVSPEGRFLRVNHKFCDILGYSAEALQLKTLHEVTHPNDLEENVKAADKLMGGAIKVHAAEVRCIHKDGVPVWVKLTVSVKHNPAGTAQYFIVFIEDVSDRKQVEEALRFSEKRYRLLFNSMQIGFALHDIICDGSGKPCDYRFLDVNPAFEQLTGLRRKEIIGKRVLEVLPGTEPRWIELYGRVALTGVPACFEGFAREFNKYLDVVAFSPEKGMFAITFTDRTIQLQAEKTLRKSERKLRLLSKSLLTAQEEERRRIAFGLHDELGQALATLKLQIKSISQKIDQKQQHLKKESQNILQYVDRIIENVRRLSRGLSPTILRDLGLSAALRWLSKESTKHSDLTLSLDIAEIDGLFTRQGQVMIYRIFQEIFTNIGKHSRASQVAVRIEKMGRSVSFRVEDDGRGFDLRKAGALTLTEKGLGLTAMEERAKMLGGHLDITSRKGKGTCTILTLPIQLEGGEP
jgi:PAS domain S-box-containing protein